MKVGMIQSNYIPWKGYFDFIDDVDLFIFYDDVQYTHRDWRNRNVIKTRDGLIWLTVPVKHDNSTLIQSAVIDNSQRWSDKHIKAISLAYGKTKYYGTYCDGLFEIIRKKHDTISELNIELIIWVMNKLNIKTLTRMSREFEIDGNKYERPLKILKQIGATSYLSGPAAKPYTDSAQYAEAGIELLYKSYSYLEYDQQFPPFVHGVTILDLIFNCGCEERKYFKSITPNQTL